MKQKRGLSDLVSTVLLVSSAIAIAILIFLWISHSSREETEKSADIGTAEQLCKDIEIKITEASKTGSSISLGVENLQNRKITALRVRLENANNVEVKKIEGGVDEYETVHEFLTPTKIQLTGAIKIKVIPEITLQSPDIKSAEAGWWLCSNKAVEYTIA